MQRVERIGKMKCYRIITLLVCVVVLMAGCKTRSGIGGEAAAGKEAAAHASRKGEGVDAVTGATVGGNAGASIVKVMERQRKEIEEAAPPGVRVEAVGGGEALKVTLDTDVFFAANSSTLKTASRGALAELSAVLNERADMDIKIFCYTDNTGKAEYNLILSTKRAKSIYDRMIGCGVEGHRMACEGKGDADPIADNGTPEGRMQNRRVEILLFAGEGMLRAAQEGTLK